MTPETAASLILPSPPTASVPAKRLALKVSVDTYKGARDGIPWLLETLQAHDAKATFFVTLGPDRSGRQVGQLFKRGGLTWKHLRLRHDKTSLLYGWLLPAPEIGKRCAEQLRSLQTAGFEIGISAWDRIDWLKQVGSASNPWSEKQLQQAIDAYQHLFGETPRAYSAIDGQINRHTLRLQQRLGFAYAADSQGTAHSGPFLPLWCAEPIHCLQVPSTLPSLDQVMQQENLGEAGAVSHLLKQSAALPESTIPVYALSAEREGLRQQDSFLQLLAGWREQGYTLCGLDQLAYGCDISKLPRCPVSLEASTGSAPRLTQAPAIGTSGVFA